MSSGAKDQEQVLKFARFRDHGWRHVALYPSCTAPHVLIAKPFQPPHNDVFPTGKELSEIF